MSVHTEAPLSPAEPLLREVRADLARTEAAQRSASSARESDRLYERVLRYRRIIAMLENRARIASSRVDPWSGDLARKPRASA